MPNMTFSGGVITDAVRTIGIQGDGAAVPGGVGVWPAATNLCTNGGFESGFTGWSDFNYSGGLPTFSNPSGSSKFGTKSGRMVQTVAGADAGKGIAFTVSSGQTYTVSAWVNVSSFTAAALGNRGLFLLDGGNVVNAAITGATSGYVRLTATRTMSGTSLEVRLYGPQGTVDWDGVQIETGPIATPYIETNGATATRAVANVNPPASLIQTSKGFMAARLNLGFNTSQVTAMTAGNPVVFRMMTTTSQYIGATFLMGGANTLRFHNGSANTDFTIPATLAGSNVTVVISWDGAAGNIWFYGPAGNFSSSFTFTTPTGTPASFGIGCQTNTGAQQLCGAVLWFACGMGPLSNSDAASLNGFGNTPPQLNELMAILSTGSSPTMTWSAITTAYVATGLGFVCQMSATNPPNLLASDGASWVDITPYVQKYEINRGKTRIIDRFETGTMSLVLKNTDRRFDPVNASGPYYPNLRPMIPIRAGFVIGGVTQWGFTGYVERWPQVWAGPTWAEVDLIAVDGFEFVSNHGLTSSYAYGYIYATAPAVILVFTSNVIGYVGNSTKVTLTVAGTNTPLSISVVGTAITVNLQTNGGGVCTSTLGDVKNLIQNNVAANALVSVSYIGGGQDWFQITAIAPGTSSSVTLSGGTFTQQLSGARVDAVLTASGYPTGSSYRAISAGTVQVQAETFAASETTKAIDELYNDEATEDGALYFDRNGRIVFLDRTALTVGAALVPYATLTDALGETPGTFQYQEGTEGHFDIDLVYNNISSQRLNSSTTQTATDTSSNANYFTRSLSISPLSISDTDSLALAQAMLLRFKQPQFYFDAITCFPGTNPDFWDMLGQLELMNTLKIVRHPPGAGAPINSIGPAVKITISGDKDAKNTVWQIQVVPGFPVNFIILDDPVYGKLDTATNGLGY